MGGESDLLVAAATETAAAALSGIVRGMAIAQPLAMVLAMVHATATLTAVSAMTDVTATRSVPPAALEATTIVTAT